MSEAKRKDDYQKALSLYNQGIKDFRKGDYDRALASFKELLEKYPEEHELVDRSRVYMTICERGTKKESFSPRNLEDYLFYAQMKINHGDYPGALKLLEKALEFKREEARIYYLMATAYVQGNQVEEGLEVLKKALQKDKSLAVMAQNEPDFEPIWEDKRFKVLVKLS
ncbi:MAG: TPR end-of-group domain-containing protein [Candidatus Saccharicenans sp.]|uniref:TPR end-of-group domain-containing protein n=1 Tax=Candidatus Saccharicenans sp. TaxID=2819258 RepID=UPI00404B876F